MKVYTFEGDPDYITARCVHWDQDKIIQRAELEDAVPDRETCFEMTYGFAAPVGEGVVTDCPYLSPNNALLLSSRAVDALQPLLMESGVICPATPDLGVGYRMYVCTRKIDALDQDRTELCDQERFMPWDISRFVFRPETLEGAGIFRVDGLFGRLFATDRLIEAMAGHRLSGFCVRALWSSERGPLVTIPRPGAEFIRYPPGFGTTLSEKRQAMRDYIAGRR